MPASVSPPVSRRGSDDLTETWEFYRVEWIELDDGGRLSYSAKDYREAASGTLVFSDVRAARERGGMAMDAYRSLARERADAGYPDTPERPPMEGAGDADEVTEPAADAGAAHGEAQRAEAARMVDEHLAIAHPEVGTDAVHHVVARKQQRVTEVAGALDVANDHRGASGTSNAV